MTVTLPDRGLFSWKRRSADFKKNKARKFSTEGFIRNRSMNKSELYRIKYKSFFSNGVKTL